ncbi:MULTISPECIES: rubrerythrin family protein [Halorussus]|uniref:rubrerythrin family protein n=1 Tax=Halorussus TaxID=1070314 RepID=UPI00209D6D02|nr:rubrerythrin family protein [Halorussus vallis]USZ75180.1 rubrerythrin family protein [Halorussus vallis]
MEPASFVDAVREAKATELDRLGSQQSVVALTDADLTTEAVLGALARSEAAARETFSGWAETEADEEAREAFASLARTEGDHYDRVVAELDGEDRDLDESPGEVDPMHEHLRGLSTTVERAAGLVGRSLVGDRAQVQVVNFFVNEADERRADVVRELRAETRQAAEEGAKLLATRCDGEDDWERARDVAEQTVRVAYDDYAETLEGMGLDPKPLC